MTQTASSMESPSGTPYLTFQRARRAIRRFMCQLLRQPTALIGLIIVLFYIVMALVGPTISPYEFDEIVRDANNCVTTGGSTRCVALKNAPPSPAHLMGTDSLGRDVLSRILWGARETIGLSSIATILSVTLGTILGLAIGYFGGWIDELISRVMDSLLAIPALVLALVMLTTIVPVLKNSGSAVVNLFGAESISLIIVILLLYTPIVTRVMRSATLNVRSAGYVEIAKLRGEPIHYILFREILPSVLPALVVEASLRFSYAIFLVASLGFLGLGFQPPSPEWGRMVLDARIDYAVSPWALWYPVLAIGSLIIGVNLLSDGLRRILRYEEGRL